MHFDVILDIEAPLNEEGELYPAILAKLHSCRELFGLESLPDKKPCEHGCWEDDNVGRWRFDDLLDRPAFDKLTELLELRCSPDAANSLEFDAKRGAYYLPRLMFDGITRFTRRFPVGEHAVVDAYVTPYPDFDPKNRSSDKLPPGVLSLAEWQLRCWKRIRRAMLEVYG